MQGCPCCARPAPFASWLPARPHRRRLSTVSAQLGAAAASPPKKGQTEPFLPLPADRVDPSRHGRPMGMQGSFEGLRNPKDPQKFAPFRIKHTVGQFFSSGGMPRPRGLTWAIDGLRKEYLAG